MPSGVSSLKLSKNGLPIIANLQGAYASNICETRNLAVVRGDK